MWRVLVVVAAVLSASACAPARPNVGKARLVDADAVTIPPPEGTTVEIDADGAVSLPDALSGTVRLAIDQDAPYSEVVKVVRKLRAGGHEPVALVVSPREKLAALVMPPLGTNEADTIRLDARTDGKACVAPPGETEKEACVARRDTKHLDRAFIRQLLYRAVHEYHLTRVHVMVPDGALAWADVVRVVDGARTCCEKEEIKVTIEP